MVFFAKLGGGGQSDCAILHKKNGFFFKASLTEAGSKMLNYRIDGSPFVYIIFQASSGRELDQNKGLPSIL